MTEVNAPPSTLVEFLTARLDEDEQQANNDAWNAVQPSGSWYCTQHDQSHPGDCASGDISDPQYVDAPFSVAPRIAADIAAKRAILERSLATEKWSELHWDEYAGEATGLAVAVALLGAVYSDHPDYREEWR